MRIDTLCNNIYDIGFELEVNDNFKRNVINKIESKWIKIDRKNEVGTQTEILNRESAWSYLHKVDDDLVKYIEKVQRKNKGSDWMTAGSCHLHIFTKLKTDYIWDRENLRRLVARLINATWIWPLRGHRLYRHFMWLRHYELKVSFLTIRNTNIWLDFEFRLNEQFPKFGVIAYYITLIYLAINKKDLGLKYVPNWNPQVVQPYSRWRHKPNILFEKEAKKNYKKLLPYINKVEEKLRKKQQNEFKLLI